MKTTKKQFHRLLQEVVTEVISETKPLLNEALSAVVAKRPQESIAEAPQKNLPGSEPDKWKAISGANPSKPVSNDIQQFAKELLEKITDRQRKKGFDDMNLGNAILDMIKFKMSKEGWSKGQSDTDALQARRNAGDPRESISEGMDGEKEERIRAEMRKLLSHTFQEPLLSKAIDDAIQAIKDSLGKTNEPYKSSSNSDIMKMKKGLGFDVKDVREDRRKEANDKLEFEKWLKQFNPGLTPDNIAYDIAFEAWKAGKAVGYKSIQINPNWIKESSTDLNNYQKK